MQTSLFDKPTKNRYNRTTHGGQTRGKRKLERPLSTKNWIHLNLKSSKAKGALSFLLPKNKIIIDQVLKDKARKFGVSIADQANVGNHIHMKVRIASRQSFQKFLIAVTALIARKITGARRGRRFGKFWDGLAFTRVLKSYTEELNLRGYLIANRLEAATTYDAREKFRRKHVAWVYQVCVESS